MKIKKAVTNTRFFVLTGGSIGFVLCWTIALATGQSFESAFSKATMGCVAGAIAMGLFAALINQLFISLSKEKNKQIDEMTDNSSNTTKLPPNLNN